MERTRLLLEVISIFLLPPFLFLPKRTPITTATATTGAATRDTYLSSSPALHAWLSMPPATYANADIIKTQGVVRGLPLDAAGPKSIVHSEWYFLVFEWFELIQMRNVSMRSISLPLAKIHRTFASFYLVLESILITYHHHLLLLFNIKTLAFDSTTIHNHRHVCSLK